MARKSKKNYLNIFLFILLISLIGLIAFKIYDDRKKDDNNSNNKTEVKQDNNENKKEEKKDIKKEETKVNDITEKPSEDQNTEVKNETQRRGGNVTLELLGEENITISVGSDYKDAGFKAKYSDGSDASSEVDIDNSVDTSKAGTYTVTYYAGNSVVIRRVTVE
ncbi:MAG: DUF5011 domain-containing protein [Bacilli bacterium]|nr:DUF5011 domain-containing protein [Bacilli bacterium]